MGLVLMGLFLLGLFLLGLGCDDGGASSSGARLRVMTYNIDDARTPALKTGDDARLERLAARIQARSPDVLLLNEIAYDQPGGPGAVPDAPPGQNARRFVDQYLSRPQADTLAGLTYRTVMLPVNTGVPSGYDLNNDGRAVTERPPVPGRIERPTPAAEAYAQDAWGYGTFPGQYGMAVLVRPPVDILRDSIRTFRHFRWAQLPGAAEPIDSTSGEAWYTAEEWRHYRLSSTSHWDVPLRLPNGARLHVLASHPSPPTFDGPARRNARRNHDEIRFWSAYLRDAAYVEDDSSTGGGLHGDASFVLLGDLNADSRDPALYRAAVRDLLAHPRVQSHSAPTAGPSARRAYPTLDSVATTRWDKRVDYVLPSTDLRVDSSGVWRPVPRPDPPAATDHFPVWMDLRVPAPDG
jgi:endonuclease/exonuclease/phosphatase family metal-dependent hydrolase